MMALSRFFLALTLIAISGCGTPKSISRDLGGLEVESNRPKARLSVTFNSGLKLLYEKKVRGAGDSPIAIGPNWLGLKTTRDRILIFDRETGDKKCQIKKKKGMITNPIFADSLLVLVRKTPLGQVQLLNLFSGKVIGRKTINEIRSGPIITDKGLIYGTESGLILIELPSLNRKWISELKGYVDKEVVSRNDTVYCATSDGRVAALNMVTGETFWEVELEIDPAMPMALDNYLYVGSPEGMIMAITTDQGSLVWKTSVGYPVRGRPAVSEGRIYLGVNDGKIYCLDAESGQVLWDFATEGIVTASPVVSGGSVIVGSHDRYLYNLDRTSGNLIDKHRLEGPVTIPVTIEGDHIYVVCRNERLYCFEGK